MNKKEKEIQTQTELRDSTLVFLIKRNVGEISELCLAMKKRGFGKNKWNGVGGKVGDKIEETVEEAAKREAMEEIGVGVEKLEKVAELTFIFPHNSEWDQLVHVYFTEIWTGLPTESEEMRPDWFFVKEIPFDSMWPDDELWLPKLLSGKKVQAKFTLGEGDIIEAHNMQFVDSFLSK